MVRVPGGTFQMGDASPAGQRDEQPVHAVTLKPFAAGAYEVTRAEFAAFVADAGYAPPPGCMTDRSLGGRWAFDPTADWRDTGFPATDRDPVTCVSFADASAYAAWLTKRTGKAQFPTWRPAQVATCDDGQAMSAPVGSYKPNAFGLYDMAGNAWEWTADCYAPTYDAHPADGSAYAGGACDHRVLRGGSWVYGLGDLRSAHRNGLLQPTIRGGDIGFRVARAL
jgi:formylglycine-generating enzyme required for sulfatase activity